MNYLHEKFPQQLSLDVNEENFKAINFYRKIGLKECETYKIMEKQGFIKFETPYQGFKLQERKNQVPHILGQSLVQSESTSTCSDRINENQECLELFPEIL